MPNNPTRISKQHHSTQSQTRSKTTPESTRHHGILLLPYESLTHCTSYLEPPTLLYLSLVNRHFYEHVANDLTWLYAFNLHFLGIGPEVTPLGSGALLLRRTESTWRKEYINRYNLTRRWEKSHTTTITHTPHHSNVSSMILLPDGSSLLTSSLVYGIVSRSYPFTGKILKGFLDASGTLNGQGIGNPNAEFSPDVTTVALHSAGGGTVRVSWGFRSGEVALTTSPRVMELGKHSKLVRCSIADSHIGIVQHVLFGESAGGSGSTFISAGVDGRIKLWEADPRRLRCAWTGVANSTVVPEVCTKVAYSAACGLVVAGMQSGELVIWTGLRVPMAPSPLADAPPVLPTYTLRIPPPDLDIPLESLLNPNRGPRTLLIEPTNSADSAIILVHYEGDDHFYKINVIFTEHTSFTLTRFCDGPLGPIVVIKPDFATSMRKSSSYPASQTNVSPLPMAKREESSYILSGDVLGRVCIWPWDIEGRDAADMREVPSSTKFEAHDDGQVTAIEVGMTVLITGSSRGTIKIWDSLLLSHLRTIAAPHSRSTLPGELVEPGVTRIIAQHDLLVASIGSKVLAWRTRGLGSDKPWKVKGKGRTSRSTRRAPAKWNQRIDLKTDIQDSHSELDYEHRITQRNYSRERAQLSTLDELGLDEIEAVEYVLMLSRDEEEDRRSRGEGRGEESTAPHDQNTNEEGSSDDNEDSSSQSSESPILHSSPSSPTHHSSSSSYTKTPSSFTPTPIPSPRSYTSFTNISRSVSGPGTSTKVQLSPRTRAEPIEAGFGSGTGTSPLDLNPPPITTTSWRRGSDHFPIISSSSQEQHPTPPSKINWSDIVRARASPPSTNTGTASSSHPKSESESPTASGSKEFLLSAKLSHHRLSTGEAENEDEDAELQYVLELSLAEANSRGEDV